MKAPAAIPRRALIKALAHPGEFFQGLPATAAVAVPFRDVVRQYINSGGQLAPPQFADEPDSYEDFDDELDPDEEPMLTDYQIHFAVDGIQDEPPEPEPAETPAEPEVSSPGEPPEVPT